MIEQLCNEIKSAEVEHIDMNVYINKTIDENEEITKDLDAIELLRNDEREVNVKLF